MKTLQKTSNAAGFNSLNQKEYEKKTENPVGIFVETHDTSFVVSEKENLLDALLASGHEIDYQCRGGYCGSCRVKVSNGSVEYDDFPLAHIGSDEILPCCCRIKESLKIDVSLRESDYSQQGELFENTVNAIKK